MTQAAPLEPVMSTETVYQTAKRTHIDAVCGSQPFKASGDYAIAEASWYLMQCEFHLAADNMLRAWKAAKQVPSSLGTPRKIMEASTDDALLNLCMILTSGTMNPQIVKANIEKARLAAAQTAQSGIPDVDPVTRADSLAYQGDGVVGE